ncbi:MAG: hypothetical protein WCA39_06015, partial [Nitrososphaeraceae archaeon]
MTTSLNRIWKKLNTNITCPSPTVNAKKINHDIAQLNWSGTIASLLTKPSSPKIVKRNAKPNHKNLAEDVL